MKKSELQKLIREEIVKTLNEQASFEKQHVLDFINSVLKLGTKSNVFDSYLKSKKLNPTDLSDFVKEVVETIQKEYL